MGVNTGAFGGSKSVVLGGASLYRMGDITELWIDLLDFLPLFCTSGVPVRARSTPFASRFFSDSFFSRCSRAGAFRVRELAKSGLRGDETAGTCCSSSRPNGRFGGAVEGVELLGRGDEPSMGVCNPVRLSRQEKSRYLGSRRRFKALPKCRDRKSPSIQQQCLFLLSTLIVMLWILHSSPTSHALTSKLDQARPDSLISIRASGIFPSFLVILPFETPCHLL